MKTEVNIKDFKWSLRFCSEQNRTWLVSEMEWPK